MHDNIQIERVEKDGADGVTVTFSDGTIAGYVVEELLLLRPYREPAEKPPKPTRPAIKILPSKRDIPPAIPAPHPA